MRMIKVAAAILAVILLTSCGAQPRAEKSSVAATTGPVAQFAEAIVQGTDVTVTQLISDSISCLHDYSLSVRQMQVLETCQVVLISGAELEHFMEDLLETAPVVDCSRGVTLRQVEGEADPHIWLDPDNAAIMAENICVGLTAQYPQHEAAFRANTDALQVRLSELKLLGQEALADLSCRQLITFHDGFGYFAQAFDLQILAAVEEESGSEASAADLMEILALVEQYGLPAVFTETHGSDAAASVIRAETGIAVYTLDTAMGGSDYFEAMEANFAVLQEALR